MKKILSLILCMALLLSSFALLTSCKKKNRGNRYENNLFRRHYGRTSCAESGKTKDGYDFRGVFAHTKKLLEQSDFVVGNLETPLAGKEAGYTNTHLCFNAPDEYVDA